MHEHRRWIAALTVLTIASAAHPASAQNGLSLLDDATVAPRGLVRLRLATIWTRYDRRFGPSALTPLGAPYTADSLGVAHLAPLDMVESLVQGASAAPSFRLSLGRSRLDAMVREEFAPITVEYGVTDRLSVSLMVPWARKRLAGLFQLDSTGANVGPNPHRVSNTAAAANGLLQAQLASAATQLQSRLTTCSANPAGAGCATLLARQAEAQLLIQSSQFFAAGVGALYGSSASDGAPFVPRSQSVAQAAIAARVSDFNTRYMDLLATSTSLITAVPAAAAGPAGSDDVSRYVINELGRDTLDSREISGVGDYEVGLRWLAIDRPSRAPGALRARLLLASAVRFASGTRRAPVGVADLRIGDGAVGFDARGMLDLRRGRLGLLAGGSYTSVGSNPAMPPGDTRRISLDVEPRFYVSAPLSVHASFSQRDADYFGGTQLAGFGVSITTIDAWRRGARPLPMEMRYSHFETVGGDASAAKFTRDQLEVRIYYQPGGR